MLECQSKGKRRRQQYQLPLILVEKVPLVIKCKQLLTQIYIENLGIVSAIDVRQTLNFKP